MFWPSGLKPSFQHLPFNYVFTRFHRVCLHFYIPAAVKDWQSQHFNLTLTLSFVKADSSLHICCQLFLWISFYAPSVGVCSLFFCSQLGLLLFFCVKQFSEWAVESPGPYQRWPVRIRNPQHPLGLRREGADGEMQRFQMFSPSLCWRACLLKSETKEDLKAEECLTWTSSHISLQMVVLLIYGFHNPKNNSHKP